MGVSDIYNFIEIDQTIATSGQPTEDQFRDARDQGYEVVINLAPDGLETSLPEERELLAALGMEYHHIPVGWTDPRLDQYRQFQEVMQSSSGRRTLIHCQANYRVTAFFAPYAKAKLGWTDAQADALIERIWASNPDYRMDEAWKSFLSSAKELGEQSEN